LHTRVDVEASPGLPFGPARAPTTIPPPNFLLEMARGRLEALDPEKEGPDGRPGKWWETSNGSPVWQYKRCLHTQRHLQSCRYWPTSGEVRLKRSVLGPDAISPLSRPNFPTPDPPSLTGRGSLAKCGYVELIQGQVAAEPSVKSRTFLPLDTALMAPGIRWHFTQGRVL